VNIPGEDTIHDGWSHAIRPENNCGWMQDPTTIELVSDKKI
jgi:hypothetical protein